MSWEKSLDRYLTSCEAPIEYSKCCRSEIHEDENGNDFCTECEGKIDD